MNYKHGLRHSKLYPVWNMMNQRCYNPNNSRYYAYGARGICVYEPWLHNFYAFYNYVSKLPGYGDTELSLDRIDNDRGYEPGNLRWAQVIEQSNNKRSNRFFELNGKIKTLAQWCREYNVNYKIVHQRISRDGLSLNEALSR